MTDLALLVLRLATGGLIAGHGAQKLFGWFHGHGLDRTSGFMEMLGMRPGRFHAGLAGGTELGSGMLTAIGLASPLGPIAIVAPMTVAARTAHRGKPLWATEGGPELAVGYAASATALALAGPGRFSADRLLRVRVPWQISVAAAGVAAGAVAWTLLNARTEPAAQPQAEPQPAPEEEAELAGQAETPLPLHAGSPPTASARPAGRALRGRVQTP